MPDNTTRLPTFYIPGAAKSGTTALYHYLAQHPQIYLPSFKEPSFYNTHSFYARGVSFYLNQYYRGADSYPAVGDATPGYLAGGRVVAERIRETHGEQTPQFVILLRDPVRRAWSHYLHKRRDAQEPETFERALELEPQRLRDPNPDLFWIGYFRDGLYAQQLRLWYSYFDPDTCLVVLSDELRHKRQQTLTTIFRFLGVDDDVAISSEAQRNRAGEPRSRALMRFMSRPSRAKSWLKRLMPEVVRWQLKERVAARNVRPAAAAPVMDPATEAALRVRYADEVRDLEQLIGRNLPHWLPA